MRTFLLVLVLILIVGCDSDPLAPEDPALSLAEKVRPQFAESAIGRVMTYAEWKARFSGCEFSPGHMSQYCTFLFEAALVGLAGHLYACTKSVATGPVGFVVICSGSAMGNAKQWMTFGDTPGEDGHRNSYEHEFIERERQRQIEEQHQDKPGD